MPSHQVVPFASRRKIKLKIAKAFIPTVIPYAVGEGEFAVNMGTYALRYSLSLLSSALTDLASFPHAG